jgi:hypothetical protein
METDPSSCKLKFKMLLPQSAVPSRERVALWDKNWMLNDCADAAQPEYRIRAVTINRALAAKTKRFTFST